MNYRSPYPNELYHHGIKGQKWGVRRFQNPDGTLTEAGKKRYLTVDKNGDYQYTQKGRELHGEAVQRHYGISSEERNRRYGAIATDASRVVSKLSDKQLQKFIDDSASMSAKYTAALKTMVDNGEAYTRAFLDMETRRDVSKLALNAATMEEVHRKFHY